MISDVLALTADWRNQVVPYTRCPAVSHSRVLRRSGVKNAWRRRVRGEHLREERKRVLGEVLVNTTSAREVGSFVRVVVRDF